MILPGLLNAVELANPFDTAIEHVRQRKAGAGDLFWFPHKNCVNFALVLEPEVDQNKALEMIPLSMLALSDCLAVLLPPQVAVQFSDNKTVTVNGAVVGGIKAAMAETTGTEVIPDWLVLDVMVGLSRDESLPEPGMQPDVSTLDEEGLEEISQETFIETYARHFLSWLSAWNDDGMKSLIRAYEHKTEDGVDLDFKKIQHDLLVLSSAA